jgi:N-acetylglucosaminyldiphosphoundecaprenol N-acetyl-beta-D-mannosaminyltransferase
MQALTPDHVHGRARRIRLLGLPVDDVTMSEAIEIIDGFIACGGIHQSVVINVSKVVQASNDATLRAIIETCDLVTTDGQPIIWAARLLGTPLRARVTGIDLMQRLIEHASTRGYRVYLLGASQSVVSAVARRIAMEQPGVKIVGYHHGYWADSDEPELVARIASASPQILFVAIPSPRKEAFLGAWKDAIGAPFVMGVGGSFDVYAGVTKRAPTWMQRMGLEWLFRVIQEPRRLWRRYAWDAPRFARMVIHARLHRP